MHLTKNPSTAIRAGGLALLILAMAGCGTGQVEEVVNSPTTGSATATALTLSGTCPATTGTPSVTVGGQAATIVGTTWSCAVPAETATLRVVYASDGVAVAQKDIVITVR